MLAAFAAFVRAGFHRHATYRQATLAAAFANSAFGFLKCYLLLAVLGSAATVAGYDAPRLVTYVWVGQGLLGVVLLWGWSDLADRIRTGDVTADLLRPLNPIWTYLADDLGRAAHAVITRLLIPVAVGAVFFDLYVPARLVTYPAFVLSASLAVVVSFGVRYLVNLSAFWLLDVRGALMAWAIAGNVFSGLGVPIPFYPEWAQDLLWATPFPAMFQAPLDILVERGDVLPLLARQAAWVVVLIGVCHLVQRRAVRTLVVQGG